MSASCLNEDLVNSLMRADLVKFTYHFQHRVKLHAFNFTGKLMITIPAVCAFLRCIPVSCSSYTEQKTSCMLSAARGIHGQLQNHRMPFKYDVGEI